MGCAPSDTCLPPLGLGTRTLSSARPARLLLCVVLCHFVLGLPVGLVGYPLNTKINEFSATWWIKWTEKLHDRSVFNHQKRKEDGNSQKQKQKQKRYIYGGHEQIRTGN